MSKDDLHRSIEVQYVPHAGVWRARWTAFHAFGRTKETAFEKVAAYLMCCGDVECSLVEIDLATDEEVMGIVEAPLAEWKRSLEDFVAYAQKKADQPLAKHLRDLAAEPEEN